MKRGFFSDPKYQGIAFFGLGLGCFILAGLLVFFFSGRFSDRTSGVRAGPALSLSAKAEKSEPKQQPHPQKEQNPSPGEERKEWVVYITGAIVKPGVYSVPPESRVIALVEAAGGLLPAADPVGVNLAAPLADGVHVHVPQAGAEGSGPGAAPPAVSPRDEGFLRPSAPQYGASRGNRLVRVNSASLDELQRLPGVGPSIARAIIEHRARTGGFASLGDLLKVKGIGPKKLEDMRFHVDLK